VSYTFGNHYMKGLTMGTSVHYQTGIPINNLFAHPVYQNAGEIPFCADNTTNCTSARGSLGRTSNWGGVDFHADYPIRVDGTHQDPSGCQICSTLRISELSFPAWRVRATYGWCPQCRLRQTDRHRAVRCEREHRSRLPASVLRTLRVKFEF